MPPRNNEMKASEFRGKILEKANNIEKTVEKLDKKIDTHIEWSEKKQEEGWKVLNRHEKAMQKISDTQEHITEILPDKGFCEDVNNALKLDKEVTLADEHNIMWNDRRWLKVIGAGMVALAVAFVADVLVHVFA